MAQIYANGSFVPSNKSIFEVVAISNANGSPVSNTSPLAITSNSLTSIDSKLPSLYEGRVLVEPLGIPLVARQLTANSTSLNTALTTTCRRISMYARLADIRYLVGNTTMTASATSHYIAAGERLDIDVPSTPNIAVIRAGTTDAVLEVTELS